MQTPEITIIVPTFNERENLSELIARLSTALSDIQWEVIFVDDDSPDGTANAARELSNHNPRVRCIQRIGRRGLSTACIEGALASTSPYIAVMDGDLQHDISILPLMLETLKKDRLDIVVGSRYVQGGGVKDWDTTRLQGSRIATSLSKALLGVKLSDPMSGYFLMRREMFDNAVRHLSGIGFKLLLDLFASSPVAPKFKEVPYHFNNRHKGESKLDSRVVWDYLMLLGDKMLHGIVPVRFLSFAIIGSVGILVHLTILTSLLKGFKVGFEQAQTVATLVAIGVNFILNNLLTFSDRRLKGWHWWRGILSFYLVCGLGAFANIATATYLYNLHFYWLIAALAGILIGAVWNYAVSSVYTWD